MCLRNACQTPWSCSPAACDPLVVVVDTGLKISPRALLVKFARGSMLGEPGNTQRQRSVIMDALTALKSMTEPGTIQELPYRWKRPDPT